MQKISNEEPSVWPKDKNDTLTDLSDEIHDD